MRNQPDRPILVMAGSIREAELFSQRLAAAGIEHNLITAKTPVKVEDQYIGRAGGRGQVTVATNRVGRGIDIKLGGDVEALAHRIMAREHPGLSARDGAAYRTRLDEARVKAQTQVDAEHAALNEAGGLHVVLTEFSASLRIEMQARGRAGRQSDEGTSTLHRSLEDPVLQQPGRGEYAATTRRAEAPDATLDGTAVDALFSMARHEAELVARQERGAGGPARVATERSGSSRNRQSSPPPRSVLGKRSEIDLALPTNPAGIDLAQLAAARRGDAIPGLTDRENAALQILAPRGVEHAPQSRKAERTARAVAALIPARSFQPYQYTAADSGERDSAVPGAR